MAFGNRFGSAGEGWQTRQTWLVLLFVLVGVLAPTGCVLWFMNSAVKAQAEATRRTVAEAWRAQLRFTRDRLDALWEERAAALDRLQTTPADFARAIRAGTADSIVFLNAQGPTESAVEPPVNRPGWRDAEAFEERRNRQAALGAWSALARSESDASMAARAAQAEIRWLLRGDDKAAGKESAIRAIAENFNAGRASRGVDSSGRLIAADEQFLALNLMSPRDSRRAAVLARLVTMLNDYDHTPMPTAQRLFLMDEVRAKGQSIAFPTLEAERLAARFTEAGESHGGAGLQATSLPGVWRLTSKSGRVIALYRTDSVAAVLGGITGKTKGARISALAPGERAADDAIAAGRMLPGWQLAISDIDSAAMEQAARGRMASYLWVGYIAIGAMAIMGLFLGQSFSRQMRLARLKTDLVGAVSHELKTPLASMRLLVDSLLDEDEPDAGRTRDYLRLMAGENARLTRLVENFLTFSRIERNGPRLELRKTDPAEIVESAASVARERFQTADFSIAVEPGLPAVDADPDALLSALLNLLDNAWKYTAGEKRIQLRASSEGEQVVFAVEDNGIGIATREQKKIFRRFYQVDRLLSRETGGCGLGLSIVDSIVRAHGGSVRVTSRPGAGSTFFLCLPGLRS